MVDVLRCTWFVPSEGFRWQGEGVSSTLVENVSTQVAWETKRYPVLEAYPAIHRTFADLVPTGSFSDETVTPEKLDLATEAILGFANKYGSLGRFYDAKYFEFDNFHDADQDAPGEPVRYWIQQASRMKGTLAIWDALVARDVDALVDSVNVWRMAGPHYTLVDDGPPLPDGEIPSNFKELAHEAMAAIRHEINVQMLHRVPVQLRYVQESDRLALSVWPTTLRGALWLQFAREVDGNKRYARCGYCGGWFEFNPDTARTNKRYCSPSCRVRGWRKAKAEEREGLNGGKA